MSVRPSTPVIDLSADYYIRLTRRDLWRLPLRHLKTDYPLTLDGLFNGYTEWVASVNDVIVSVACYWRRHTDGSLVSPSPLDISTNLMVLDANGYDEGTFVTGEMLLAVLKARGLSPRA